MAEQEINCVPIRLRSKGEVIDGLVEWWCGARWYCMRLTVENRTFESIGRDLFETFQRIRKQIEPEGFQPLCYGASRIHYPSFMSRDMGLGLSVYKLELGKSPRGVPDLVQTFDDGPDAEPGTVEEQEAHYRAWRVSMNAGPDEFELERRLIAHDGAVRAAAEAAKAKAAAPKRDDTRLIILIFIFMALAIAERLIHPLVY